MDIKKRIAKLGLTQVSIAEKLGVTPVAVNGWVSGRTKPTIENISRLGNILGITPEEVYLSLPNRTPNTGLGRRIRLARCKLGFRQADIAKRFNVNVSTVSKWESGAIRPTSKILPRVLKTLGLSDISDEKEV